MPIGAPACWWVCRGAHLACIRLAPTPARRRVRGRSPVSRAARHGRRVRRGRRPGRSLDRHARCRWLRGHPGARRSAAGRRRRTDPGRGRRRPRSGHRVGGQPLALAGHDRRLRCLCRGRRARLGQRRRREGRTEQRPGDGHRPTPWCWGGSVSVTGPSLGSTLASSPLAQPSSTSSAEATESSVVTSERDRPSAGLGGRPEVDAVRHQGRGVVDDRQRLVEVQGDLVATGDRRDAPGDVRVSAALGGDADGGEQPERQDSGHGRGSQPT